MALVAAGGGSRRIALAGSARPGWRAEAASYLFLLPWLAGFFGLTLGPALPSLYFSFTDFDLGSEPRCFVAANFVRIATTDPKLAAAMRVAFHYDLLPFPLKLRFALAAAPVFHKGIY